MFLGSQTKNTLRGTSRLNSTTICGYDTIRLTFPLDRRPHDSAWFTSLDGAPRRPAPSPDNPCLPQLKLTGLEDSAYGGWYASHRKGFTSKTLWRQQDGVHYEYQEGQWGSYAAVECSLPKLLHGHNKSPLLPSELPGAFDALHWRVKSFLSHAPHVMTMDVWRIDATMDTRLGGELELTQVAKLLSDVPLNEVLPVRYPSGGSLRWVRKGAGRPVYRCYSKSVEAGDTNIAGQYRAESQCSGGKALAFALSRGDLSLKSLPGVVLDSEGKPPSKYPRPETLMLAATLPECLLRPLAGALGSCVGYVRGIGAMTSVKAVDLLVRNGGVSLSRAWQLVAYAHAIRNFGWEATGLKTKGRWQAEKDYKAAGVDPKHVEFSGVELAAVGGIVLGAAAGVGNVFGYVEGLKEGRELGRAAVEKAAAVASSDESEKPV